MDANKFEKYLKERYEPEVKWYDDKSISNKRWNNIIQIPVIIIGVMVPVSAAIVADKWPTIILSTIVAVGIAVLKYCKFEEHWHNYRTTCETLKKEKHYYDAEIRDYEDCDKPEELFVDRVESLISQAHTKWDSTVKKGKECNK